MCSARCGKSISIRDRGVDVEIAAVMGALSEIVGAENVSEAEAQRALHSADQSSAYAALPDVVVWPQTTEQVSKLVRYAWEHEIPVVGWGAGTSLEGQPVALHGGMVVDFSRMNQIVAIHAQDFQITVQPGILYRDMNEILARQGLFFAPDPGANASIGGMIANNAAGIRTVKYGATRDNVLALTVVLASGEVIRTGSRSVKQSAGYDLTHLMVGSEGTLGLVTQATLKLAPLPAHFSAATVAFPSVQVAAQAVFEIIGAGLNPAALELIDAPTIAILNGAEGMDLPVAPHLFLEFGGASQAALQEDLALLQEICAELDSDYFQTGMGLEARNRLWRTRHALFEILVRHYPGHKWLVTDVAVPISRYPEMVTFTADALQELGLAGSLVGHAGDGNLHTIVFYKPEDSQAAQAIGALNSRIVAQAQAMEGTCTGEHGVGVGKKKYLAAENGPGALAVMRQIKTVLDSRNILNPGKVI